MSEADERKVVLAALSAGFGKLPSDVAARTGLSTTRVTNLLKQMVKDGAVRTAVTGKGRITYSLN